MSRSALGRRILPWLTSGKPTAPLIIPRVAPQFSVSTRILQGRRLLLVAIHKEHTAGPTTSIILTKLVQAGTLTSYDAHVCGSNAWPSCRSRHAHGAHLGKVGLYQLAVMAPRPVRFGYIEQGPLTSFRRCPVSEGAVNDYMASSRPYGIITNYSIPTSTKLEKSRTFTLSFRLVL